MPMPPELMDLYELYQQELDTREFNEKEALLLSEAKEILRVSFHIVLAPCSQQPLQLNLHLLFHYLEMGEEGRN